MFSNLAWDVLCECQSIDDEMTRDCLLKEHEHWNKATCIDIATQTDNRRFVSHNACQTVFNSIWMGNLSDTHSPVNLKVSTLEWYHFLPTKCHLWWTRSHRDTYSKILRSALAYF